MDLFDPISDFFYRRQAKILNEQAKRVDLVIERADAFPGTFLFPGIVKKASIAIDGQRIGDLDYGINPLGDRLYINMIKIEPKYQRQGFALAALWQLWTLHQVPLVPLHEYGSSTGFWSIARMRFASAGAVVEVQLRASQLDEAKQRWQHLVPESESERLIREYWVWVEREKAAGRSAGPGIK